MAVTDNKRPAEEEPEEQVAEKKQKTEETPAEEEVAETVEETEDAEEVDEEEVDEDEEDDLDDEECDEDDEDACGSEDFDEEADFDSDEGDFDEDDYDEEEEDDAPPEYTLEAFKDVEGMTEEDVESFNNTYKDFEEHLAKHAEETEQEAMVLGQPQLIRPVPKSVDDFKEHLPHIYICPEAIQFRTEVEAKQQEIEENLEKECEEKSSEVSKEQYEETVAELIIKRASKLAQLYVEKIGEVKEFGDKTEDKDIKVFLHMLLCFTDMLVSGHILTMEFKDDEKDMPKQILSKAAEQWRKFLGMPLDDLKKFEITEKDRTAVQTWTKQIKESLKEGETGECGEAYKEFEIEFEETK